MRALAVSAFLMLAGCKQERAHAPPPTRLTPAAGKLAPTTPCSAVVVRAPGEGLASAPDWRGVATLLGLEAKTETQAKGAVCIRSWTADGSGDDHDVCTGASPWLVSHEHQMYFQRSHAIIQQTPAGPLYVADLEMTGSWPAHCTGTRDVAAKVVGQVAWTTRTFDGGSGALLEPGASQAGAVNPIEMGDVVCADAAGEVTDDFYDLRTGTELLRVTRPTAVGAREPKTTLTLRGNEVVLAGDCDQRVALVEP